MSKNFELLLQAGKELGIVDSSRPKTVLLGSYSSGNHHKNGVGLNLDQMAQDELLKLVQRVFSAPGRESPHAVMFVGVDSEDGSSRVCIGAAKTLAMTVQDSVCLVDANLRSDFLPRTLLATNYHGLVDALREDDPIRNFAQQLCPDNLWLLPSGPRADFATFWSADRLKTRLAELRTEFDYVLINVPPVVVDGMAAFLGGLADGAILVVEANSTHREVARRARENLESANVRLFGAVFNNRTFPIPSALYARL